jgi:hypothetical protein
VPVSGINCFDIRPLYAQRGRASTTQTRYRPSIGVSTEKDDVDQPGSIDKSADASHAKWLLFARCISRKPGRIRKSARKFKLAPAAYILVSYREAALWRHFSLAGARLRRSHSIDVHTNSFTLMLRRMEASMRKTTSATVLGFVALGAVTTASTAVSAAAPISPPAAPSSNAEQVGYVCNAWGPCWWRPNYYRPYRYGYPYRYYRYRYDDDDNGPRYYRRPYGYYGPPRFYRGDEDDD